MDRENIEDWLVFGIKLLAVLLLLVLIGGSIYTFTQVNNSLANVESNIDTQIKSAISQFKPLTLSEPRTLSTTAAGKKESVASIVAKARIAFETSDILEGRKQLVLLNSALEFNNGTQQARQLNRDLLAAIDRGDITLAQTFSDQLLAELKNVDKNVT